MQPVLPHGMIAARKHNVPFFGKRFHNEAGREIPGVGKVPDRKIERSISKFGFGRCE